MNSRFPSSRWRTPLTQPPAGFTLLELLVVVAILGLLTTVVVPSLSHNVQSTELRNTARILAMDLARIRSRAIARQRQEILVVDAQPKDRAAYCPATLS